ncbi:conserved membrane hypothetical protein [Candidatus Sulfopaludibacter sp. SbA4]|nr:conserved membrane hypothetical protein [Candidatus Sulfopaludibacter sp. SbA4]
MNSAWLQRTILRAASFLAPGDQRAEWLEEWRSELWYVPRRGATRFCLGAFRDALWLRRNNLSPAKPIQACLESPLGCLAFLAACAAVSSLIVALLPAPRRGPPSWHMGIRELPEGCMATLMLSCLLFPAIRMAMGRAAADPHPVPWTGRLRLGIFLGLKIALVQPILLCGLVLGFLIGPVAPFAPQVAMSAIWTFTIRWVFADQQRRCPVCLRLTNDPIRIGTPSETFLEWYGSESMCSRGHGLLQISGMPASYSEQAQWLRLGDSWSGLFRSGLPSSEAAGVRPR